MVETIVKTIPSKGTRLNWALFFGVMATVVWVISMLLTLLAYTPEHLAITVEKINLIGFTTERWISAMTANLAVYAASETVVKGAEAHLNRD